MSKLLKKSAIMLRRQPHRKFYLVNDILLGLCAPLQFFTDAKQGKNKKSVIQALVPHIGDTLSGKGIAFPILLQVLSEHRF